MIREIQETTDGATVELVKPQTDADVRELRDASRKRNVETGTSLADVEEDTDADLVAAGVLEPDERE